MEVDVDATECVKEDVEVGTYFKTFQEVWVFERC